MLEKVFHPQQCIPPISLHGGVPSLLPTGRAKTWFPDSSKRPMSSCRKALSNPRAAQKVTRHSESKGRAVDSRSPVRVSQALPHLKLEEKSPKNKKGTSESG